MSINNIVYLPLHVWDREFDSRFFLSFLLAQLGYSSIIGHEYNIAPLYYESSDCYLFRAGGPLNHPTRDKWHHDVCSQSGRVVTHDEEGINNLFFTSSHTSFNSKAELKLDSSKIELIDIQIPSIKNVSLQLAWGEQHAQKLIHQYTTPSAKIIAKEQTKIAGPFRFNFLSKLGNNLYSPYSSSVKS